MAYSFAERIPIESNAPLVLRKIPIEKLVRIKEEILLLTFPNQRISRQVIEIERMNSVNIEREREWTEGNKNKRDLFLKRCHSVNPIKIISKKKTSKLGRRIFFHQLDVSSYHFFHQFLELLFSSRSIDWRGKVYFECRFRFPFEFFFGFLWITNEKILETTREKWK